MVSLTLTVDEARGLAGAAEMESAILREHLRRSAALMDGRQAEVIRSESEALERAAAYIRAEADFEARKAREEADRLEELRECEAGFASGWDENQMAWGYGK